MLDYNKQRQLIVAVVIGIILVVILTIVYLIFLWTPEPEKEKVYEVGSVDIVQKSEEDILLKYYDEISKMLMASDLDKLASLVSEQYLEYKDYTIEDVKKYIADKNITNKKLELASSSIYSFSEYTNVYYLDIKASGEVYSLGVVVIEESPNNYKLSFDKFVDYKENIYSTSLESIGLVIKNRTRFLTSVDYRVRITNNYDKAITINSKKAANPLNLVSSIEGTVRSPITLNFSNKVVVIPSGEAREYTVTYNMNGVTDYLVYNVMVLKDVSYEGITGTKDLEYYLNK